MGLMNSWRRLARAALLLAALLALPAAARTVLELDVARQPVPLLDWGDSWTDPTGQARPESVAEDATIGWAPTRPGGVYPLTTGQALWFRFTVPPAPDAERWYLDIPYPSVDRVTLYTLDSVGHWTAQSAGDSQPVASWPVPHRHPLLPIAVSAEDPRKYLLKVENAHSFSAPLSFISESHLSRSEQRTSLILGIYFGLAGLAALLAALSAVSLRDPAYGLYALSVTLMGFTQAAMTGIAGLHLWSEWPWWNDVAPLVLPMLTVGSLLWFFAHVVALHERSPRLYLAMLGLAGASVAASVAVMLAPPGHRFQIMVPYVLVSTLVGTSLVVWAASRGDRFGLWLVLGTVPVIIGGMFPLARLAGLMPIGFLTMHGMQLGIAVELPVLLVILMLRSQHRREHNRRVQGLDRIDPETGLINAMVFMERLERMISRSQKLNIHSAVMLVDIVNIEQIRRTFDRRAADELPLRVAGRLLSAAREIDSVARLTDRRFGILMEGPLGPEDAASAGPRVVARCLMPFKNKPLEWVAQVRVAQTSVPTATGMEAPRVMERLEALLAAVPADSKRAVFTLRGDSPRPSVDPVVIT